MKLKLWHTGLFLVLILLISGCTGQLQQTGTAGNEQADLTGELGQTHPNAQELETRTVKVLLTVEANGETILSEDVESQQEWNALAILESQTNVETQDSTYGKFITSIAGIPGGETHYWAIYVNEEYAQVGAEMIEAEEGLYLLFRLEKIEF